VNFLNTRIGMKEGGETNPQIIVTDADREAASKDRYTSSLFGSRAPEAYATGLRPMNIGNQIVYMPNSDNFKMQGGGRIGFVVNSGRRFDMVRINDDGTTSQLDDKSSQYRNIPGEQVVDFVRKMYGGRIDNILEAQKENKPIPAAGAYVARKK
jgi:hypothetical protein